MAQKNEKKTIPALKVRQWKPQWDKVVFDVEEHRRKPQPHFYLFSLSAADLKLLSGIQRRTLDGTILRSEDLGIQRRHDKDRSDEIGKFLDYGFPWSDLSQAQRKSDDYVTLRKPGWLPTAIIVNILPPGEVRNEKSVAKEDLIEVDDHGDSPTITLPKNFDPKTWKPKQLPPLEVIDGQHRLWAFEEKTPDSNFELPVVAFYGLDISWQAYLFYTINIKPKKISGSLAYDLYPLLRTEDWLEKFDGHSIYRETRAQELTEALWANSLSPWHHRINMLGESGLKGMVSQAAWIKSLLATYVKRWEEKEGRVGGLFGARLGSHEQILNWSRAQQAAFLIMVGQKIRGAIADSKDKWAMSLRKSESHSSSYDGAFLSSYSLLNTDQGIRGILYATNDLTFVLAKELELRKWEIDENAAALDEQAVKEALQSLNKQKVAPFVEQIASSLSSFDWRTSSAPGLSLEESTLKAALRGSGGYKVLRLQLLQLLSKEKGDVGKAAKNVITYLGY